MFMKEITITQKSRIALQLWIEAEKSVLNTSKSGYIYSLKLINLNENLRILRKLEKRLAKNNISYYQRRINQTPAGYRDKIDRYERLIIRTQEYLQTFNQGFNYEKEIHELETQLIKIKTNDH